MCMGRTLCLLLQIVLFSINSQSLSEVVASDLLSNIAATHHVLTHPLKYPWSVLSTFITLLEF